jgi:hypothetical protein
VLQAVLQRKAGDEPGQVAQTELEQRKHHEHVVRREREGECALVGFDLSLELLRHHKPAKNLRRRLQRSAQGARG